MVTTFHYLLLSAALFTIGVIGVLTRRNIMIILMSIELMMNAVNINLIAFSDRLQQVTGQVFAIFVITVAAAEAAVGLGIVIAMFKNKETMNIKAIDLLKWKFFRSDLINFPDLICLIAPFPALGFLITGLLGKRLPKLAVAFIAAGAVLFSFILSAGAVLSLLQLEPAQRAHTVNLYEWINAGLAHTTEGP